MIQKFRVWVKSESRMIDSEKIASLDFLEKQIAESKISANKDGSLGVVEYTYRNFDDVELMQSTGVKDINGIEIYEGDIVKTPTDNVLSLIKFDNLIGVYVCLNNSYLFTGVESLEELEELKNNMSTIEVVGNIYENPELLEVG